MAFDAMGHRKIVGILREKNCTHTHTIPWEGDCLGETLK